MIGVSPSLIGQIERGQSQPSVATLFALAEALEVPVDAFFARDEASAEPSRKSPLVARLEVPTHERRPPRRFVVRQGARSAIKVDDGVLWEQLTRGTLPQADFLELVYQPGAESNAGLYRHPGAQMMLVLSGRFDVSIGAERHELGPGDSIHVPPSVLYRYVNPTDEVARAALVILHDSAPPPPAERGPADVVTAGRHLRWYRSRDGELKGDDA
jgi:transcriptional regulator with XRE-family HTH domain